jgi:hypothetical protein
MPRSLSAIHAAYSAAQELGYWSHQVLVAAREPDLPNGPRVLYGSRILAALARHVILEGPRATAAKLILDASDAILTANLSRGEYRIGEIVETTAHKAVLAYAQSIVNVAWHRQAQRMRAGTEEPQDNDPDWPMTWATAVWPHIRGVFAEKSVFDWNAVRVALEREHAATAAAVVTASPHDQGGAAEGEQPEVVKLAPSRLKAYQQFQWAVTMNPELEGASDQQVYDWLTEHLDEGDPLPLFGTWRRYVSEARAAYDTRKHNLRAGRETGRSAVRPDEI